MSFREDLQKIANVKNISFDAVVEEAVREASGNNEDHVRLFTKPALRVIQSSLEAPEFIRSYLINHPSIPEPAS